MIKNSSNRARVAALSPMSHALGIQTVAEPTTAPPWSGACASRARYASGYS